MDIVVSALLILTIVLALGLVFVTASLNTKSEGLGAAITGATDTYRGAVGVEEGKRRLLRQLCYAFMAVAFIYGIVVTFA